MRKFTVNTKKAMKKTLAFALAVLMMSGSASVIANAEGGNVEKISTNDIRLLTYEEYVEQKEIETQNSDVSTVMQSASEENVMCSTTELSEGKDIINCENVNELTPLTNIQLAGMATRTIPVVSLKPVALNTDSLKDGQITTETQIAWLWDYADADGDTIMKRYLGGFPGAYYLGDLNNELGFVTQFDNPGHYTVLYQVMDSAGEVSEVVGYEFDVVPVENYQIIEGNFSAENEIQTYNVAVDFTNMDTAAFCLVRTGKSNASMTILDAEGTELAVRGTSMSSSRRWYFLDKPSSDTTVATYTIKVKAISYDSSGTDYRIMIGSKEDAEPMISGLENAVWIDLYSEEKGNQFFTYYTPNRDESWYRFTADGTMVFTLLTYYPQIRFQIRDVNDLYVLFDSNDVDNADVHKTKFCTSSYGHAEKARLTTTIGQDYYLVVYSPSLISTQDFIEKTMNITVGKPNMLSSSTTVYASSSLRATATGYSSAANIYVGDNGDTIPVTAVADDVSIRSATSGIRLSMIPYWRVRHPSSSTWLNSKNFYPSIDIGYVKDSNTNKNINGTWQISVQASSTSSPLTFVPGLYISYHYEIGD